MGVALLLPLTNLDILISPVLPRDKAFELELFAEWPGVLISILLVMGATSSLFRIGFLLYDFLNRVPAELTLLRIILSFFLV